MPTYDLYKLLKEELQNGSKDLVTRSSGEVLRRRIEMNILNEEDGGVIALDFSGIGVIDYSCADELVAKLISRLISEEYGDKYIILVGLNKNQRENIAVALERKDLAAMVEMENGEKIFLGTLHNYLKETLLLILKKRKVTARDASEILGIRLNTSGTRLLNLYKKRLVKREDEIIDGDRVWVYKNLLIYRVSQN